MNFELNEEQKMLQSSIERVLREQYSFEAREGYISTELGWSREVWSCFAELGLLGLPFDERFGGGSGGPVDVMVTMEALGKALTLEPYLSTVILCGGLIQIAGDEVQSLALLPQIAKGRLLVSLAGAETHAQFDPMNVLTSATRVGRGWRLNGSKVAVLHGGTADKFLVTARAEGSGDGLSLFVVDARTRGVSISTYRTYDGHQAADVVFSDASLGGDALLGEPGTAVEAVRKAIARTVSALAAEAVGVMDATLKITIEYLKTRTQFGSALGAFQVLQHRAVDMMIDIEQARSMSMFAATMAEEVDTRKRENALSAVKVQVGRSSRFVSQQAVQLHGAMGLASEYMVGHYCKRLTAFEAYFGDSHSHLERLSGVQGPIFD